MVLAGMVQLGWRMQVHFMSISGVSAQITREAGGSCVSPLLFSHRPGSVSAGGASSWLGHGITGFPDREHRSHKAS